MKAKRLQVLIEGNWEYVFCRNELKKAPVTTKDEAKAIKGNEDSLQYFQRFFSEYSFRIN